MTFNDLYVLLKESGIPQKRIKSKKVLSPPYMVVCEGASSYDGSDNEILLEHINPRIELYTTETDYTSYQQVCDVLTRNNIQFTADDEIEIPDEALFVRYFYLNEQINIKE